MPGDVVTQAFDRTARPAWVRFERVPVEDKAATLREGRWMGKDVDYVYITPPYSKDEVVKKAEVWVEQLKMQVTQEKIPQLWMDQYLASYVAWKNGQELPLHGTPIKGWGMISPAQQETLIHAKIRTVEDLAGINDEGMRAVGMGSMELKNKAVAWLAQLNDKGPLTIEIAEVKKENVVLKGSVESLTRQVAELTALVKAQQLGYAPASPTATSEAITAADILPEDEPIPPLAPEPAIVEKKRRGNPNWVKKAPA